MCPTDDSTMYPLPRYGAIFLAFVGDSTITRRRRGAAAAALGVADRRPPPALGVGSVVGCVSVVT
jgi:hypothetical protein